MGVKDRDNPNFKYEISKEFLIKEYIVNKKSIEKISHIVGCSIGPIRRNLIKYGIKIRTVSEGCSIGHTGKKFTQKHKDNIGKATKKRFTKKERLRYSKIFTGKNNPNYRHGKNIINNCEKCGIEIDGRSKNCPKCKPNNSFKGKRHTKESLNKIGIASKNKFTKKYKKKQRKQFELMGIWVPLKELSLYKRYMRLSNWIKELNIEYSKHLVRDHRYSRYSGFKNKVYPVILRHPVNCEILTRSENIIKRSNNSISLNMLFKLIKEYDKEWVEQKECLKMINYYKKGKRFSVVRSES